MTKSRYGLLAGLAGAAFAAWWWHGRTDWVARKMSSASSNHGHTIYRNSPVTN